MFMWSVHVHHPLSQLDESGKGCGRSVDELAIGAVDGKRSSNAQFSAFAGFQTVFIQKRCNRCPHRHDVKHSLNHASIRTRSNHRTIRSLADYQMDGPKNDRFSRSGFTRDHVETAFQFEREVCHQGEILDS